mgnify:CR=1 FL=1
MLLNLLKAKLISKFFSKMIHGKNNIMVILSSPSGASKTTLTKKFQQKYQSFKISVSHTTRKPRSNEVDGVDYFFVSQNEFKKCL